MKDASRLAPARLALLAGAALLYLLCRHAYYVGFFNDDAFYIIGARSLLRGRYAELNAPGAPPLVNYFPGFSILLAPVAALAGGALWPYQLACGALTLAALAAFAPVAEALCPASGLAALALAALTPLTVSMSGTVLSDVPLSAGAMIALAWARRLWPERKLERWLPLALLAGFCALLRPTGVALCAAFTLALAFERRPREALLFWFSGCLFVVPFLARNRILTGVGLSYFLELTKPYEGGRLSALLDQGLANLGFYAKLCFSTMLYRPPFDGPARLVSGVVAASAGVGAVAFGYGARDAGAKGWAKLPALWLAAFLAIHLAWGKQAGRYMLPVLPLVFAYFLRGVGLLAARAGSRAPLARWAAALALALLVWPDARIVQASWTRATSVTRPPERTLAWIRASTPEDAVFAAELDGRLFVLSGRRAVRIPRLFKPEELRSWLASRGVGFVEVQPNDFSLTTARGDAFNDPMPLDALTSLLRDPGRYELAFADAQERTAIFRVLPR